MHSMTALSFRILQLKKLRHLNRTFHRQIATHGIFGVITNTVSGSTEAVEQ